MKPSYYTGQAVSRDQLGNLRSSRGAKAIITNSSDDKLKRVQQLGADLLINYNATQFKDTPVMTF